VVRVHAVRGGVDTGTILRELGRRCAELRVAKGLTQEQLAELLGVETRYLQGIEAGARNFTMRTLIALASRLGVEPSALFEPPTSTEAPRPGRPRRKPRA
jgi:transcriptional regulator with XRE-family HTH domain